jgi:hypothetical protein
MPHTEAVSRVESFVIHCLCSGESDERFCRPRFTRQSCHVPFGAFGENNVEKGDLEIC